MRLTLESIDSMKQIAFPTVEGPHPVHSRPEQNKRLYKQEFFLSAWWSSCWDVGPLSLHSDSEWKLHYQFSWFPDFLFLSLYIYIYKSTFMFIFIFKHVYVCTYTHTQPIGSVRRILIQQDMITKFLNSRTTTTKSRVN